MASLLQITRAFKSYGDQVLLDDAEATINDNVKVGFIGRNGAGKSTLLRVLLGEEELDSGEIIRNPSLRLGYLRQHDPFVPGETALEFLMRDSGEPDWKCGEVAGQFELKGAYLLGPIAKLSGGWQTRVKLAALLLHEPNLLLLDEPTNFLDLRTQILFGTLSCGACQIRVPDPSPVTGAWPGRDLRPHAGAIPGEADDVSGQDRCLHGIPARETHSRRARERFHSCEAASPGRVHRQEQGAGRYRHPGEIQGQAARTPGTKTTLPATRATARIPRALARRAAW